MRHTLLLTCVALAAAAIMPSPATADSCNGTDAGFGQVQESCNFSCSKGNWLSVSGSVDDNGGIEVTAECGGATAKCIGNGSCGARGHNTATMAAAAGTCAASGYGGAWTTIGYGCATGSGGGVGEDVEALRKVRNLVQYNPPGVPGIWVTVVDGVPSGVSCGLAGCLRIQPTCDFRPDHTWTCVAG